MSNKQQDMFSPSTFGACVGYVKANQGTSTMMVKAVKGGDTFPTTRPNGSPLIVGDWVKPASDATFPFTISGITFNSINDQAVWGGASWLYNANPFQKTSETPVANKSDESLAGTSDYQSQINAENKTAINDLISKVVQVSTMPTASADLLGKILQFIGTTTTDYTNGYFYICEEVTPATTPATYRWVNKLVQDDSGFTPEYIELTGSIDDGEWHNGGTLTDEQAALLLRNELNYIWLNGMHLLSFRYKDNAAHLATYASSDVNKTHSVEINTNTKVWRYNHTLLAKQSELQIIQVATLPTASSSLLNKIYQFIGTTTADYTNGYFYKCLEITPSTTPATYHWVRVDVQPSGGGSLVEFDEKTIIKGSDNKYKTAIGGYVRTVPEDKIMLTEGNATKTTAYTFTWATASADIKRLYEEVAVNDIEVSLEGEIDGVSFDGEATGTASAISSNEVRWVIRFPATSEQFRLYVTYNHSTEVASIEALTTNDVSAFSMDCKYVVSAEHEEVEHINPAVIPLNAEQFEIDSHDEISLADWLYIDSTATEVTDDELDFLETHYNIVIQTSVDSEEIYLQRLSDDSAHKFVAIKKSGNSASLVSMIIDKTTKAITLETTSLSSVSVSGTGTSTNQVQYITINGTEYKLAGGGGGSVDLDNRTLFKDPETNKIYAIYGGGRTVATTETVSALSATGGIYDTSLGVPLMVFGAIANPDKWEVGNKISYEVNVNGTVYSEDNVVLQNITLGTLGTFKAIPMTNFIETGSTSYMAYIGAPTNMLVIYTTASISSSTLMIANYVTMTYNVYNYFPIEKQYIPVETRYFEFNSENLLEPKVKIGTWDESREIINNSNVPTYTVSSDYIVFNVDGSSEAANNNVIEVNYSVVVTSRGRVRSVAKGALTAISANEYQAVLDHVSGDDNIFQVIRFSKATTPAEVQLQLIGEVPVAEIEGIDSMSIRQNTWDSVDHPIDSKYIKTDNVTIKKNAQGQLYAEVAGTNPDNKTIKLNGSNQLETAAGGWAETVGGVTTYHPIGANFVPTDTADFKIVSDLIQVKRRARVELYDYTLTGTPYNIAQQPWDTNGEYLKAIDLTVTGMKANMVQVDFVCDTAFLNNMAPFLLPQTDKLVIYLKTATTTVNASIIKCVYEEEAVS